MRREVRPQRKHKGFRKAIRHIPALYRLARRINCAWRNIFGARRLKRLAGRSPCRIVIGASGIYAQGWIPTDVDYLDLLKESDWRRFFQPGSLDAVLAEHVWEHLSPEEGLEAARRCFRYLKAGGYLRVAVPDRLNPNRTPENIDHIKVGGTAGHKVFYDYRQLKALFESAGFQVELLEYFDERGEFHFSEWDPGQGMIWRSARFDERNPPGRLLLSSVILDARKPG